MGWIVSFQNICEILPEYLSSVQFSCLVVFDSLRPHGLQHARLPCPSPTPSQTHVHWISDAIQLSHSLSSPSFPAFNLSQHQGLQMSQFFISGGQNIGVSASASVLPRNSGLISFRMDWLDLLAVQETRKSLLQHHSSKASIFRCSAFFIVQLSHPSMTTGKTLAFH